MDPVQWVRENVTLTVLAGAVLAYLIPPVRNWLLTRVFGHMWLKITQPTRDAERRAAARQERDRELREAVGVLEQGLATGSAIDSNAGVQINQALSVIERRWPDLQLQIDTVVNAAVDGDALDLQTQRHFMRPFVERLRRELGEG